MAKRTFDFSVSLLLVAVLFPLLMITAVLVQKKMGSPVFFKQVRPGLKGEPFIMYKFRTLTDVRDEKGDFLPDSQRMTRFGSILRKSSLDELPELINVLKGDMSLVGPRPLLMQYLDRYTPEQARRHDVKPGITGWAQVNGRNLLSWPEKFNLDVWYVDHHSFLLDVKILILTFISVFRSHGINQDGQATAEEFMGNIDNGQ